MPEQTMDAAPDTDSTLSIDSGTVVTFHYDLYVDGAERFETSKDSEAINLLYGDGMVLASMWDALRGKVAGEDLSITLPAEQAYGRRYPDRVQRVTLKRLGLKNRKLRPGQLVRVPGEQGALPGTIVKVGKFSVDVDTNHPLAGRELTFDIAIQSVRRATESEQAHGHVHGPGGHHH